MEEKKKKLAERKKPANYAAIGDLKTKLEQREEENKKLEEEILELEKEVELED